jgi:hypothetical protein
VGRRLAGIAFGLQQESMIVTFHLALIVIAKEIGRDGFRRAEIKAGLGHVFQSPPEYRRFHRQIRIRQDLQLWLRTSLCSPSRLK